VTPSKDIIYHNNPVVKTSYTRIIM